MTTILLDYEPREHQQLADVAVSLLRKWFHADQFQDGMGFLRSVIPDVPDSDYPHLTGRPTVPSVAIVFYSRTRELPERLKLQQELGRLLSYFGIPVILVLPEGVSLPDVEAHCRLTGLAVSEVMTWKKRGRKRQIDEFVEIVSRHIVVRDSRNDSALMQYRESGLEIDRMAEADMQFSAFCPPAVRLGRTFLLEIYAYRPRLRDAVLNLGLRHKGVRESGFKSGVKLTGDESLAIQVSFPDCKVEPAVDHLRWTQGIVNSQFAVHVSDSAKTGEQIGTALILANGVEIARILIPVVFRAHWLSWLHLPKKRPLESERVKTIFASYASVDREEVLRWKRAADALGAEVFVDVMSLRSGDHFESRLWEEIKKRDLFALFWSQAASRSQWVEKEWQLAVKAKGCQFIQPIPLCDPRDAPPPDPLRNCLHFEDLTRIALEYERLWRNSNRPQN